ncbi:phosphoribosylanthranilate isomerase [Winogradskyella sp. SM1960]|uniref:phosphoribosylanthranilate isomerase n=1 Tax=Winogradskyella sp. SM1960 TaxID=2865955 RepID=UPI001CD669C8|nr:phosphoribosylanthranilate isomerase [Winogradskyella sp. SM1960]
MKLKVCGMKYKDNIQAVANLQPDYLGFIFYDQSARHFNTTIPELPKTIKKVGVFVNAKVDFIVDMISKHNLHAVQLHGNESPEYCDKLRKVCHAELVSESQLKPKNDVIEIIKVFSIKDEFNFKQLEAYEDVIDYFLFDTKGKLPGGNGFTFNWNVLKDYPSTKPYFLSGGIGINEVESVLAFLQKPESQYCYAIDVNSKFEIEPGLKNIAALEKFKTQVTSSDF